MKTNRYNGRHFAVPETLWLDPEDMWELADIRMDARARAAAGDSMGYQECVEAFAQAIRDVRDTPEHRKPCSERWVNIWNTQPGQV